MILIAINEHEHEHNLAIYHINNVEESLIEHIIRLQEIYSKVNSKYNSIQRKFMRDSCELNSSSMGMIITLSMYIQIVLSQVFK